MGVGVGEWAQRRVAWVLPVFRCVWIGKQFVAIFGSMRANGRTMSLPDITRTPGPSPRGRGGTRSITVDGFEVGQSFAPPGEKSMGRTISHRRCPSPVASPLPLPPGEGWGEGCRPKAGVSQLPEPLEGGLFKGGFSEAHPSRSANSSSERPSQ